MAEKIKDGAVEKDRRKKAGSSEKAHPDQKAAERAEDKTPGKEDRDPPQSEPETSDGPTSVRKHTSGEEADQEFPIVGIGASAGGLEALENFLSNVHEDSGMAFVVISHTDPDRASMLPDILQRKTSLDVSVLEDNTAPAPNRVYLPPHDKDLEIRAGRFRLKERERRERLHMPVDRFLKSLAEDRDDSSACVILSGTGSDGTQGLKLVKERGGWSSASRRNPPVIRECPRVR